MATFLAERGVQLRFSARACSATEVVAALVLRGEIAVQLRRASGEWSTPGWLALSTGVMQLTTLLAFGALQVGYFVALFQLSTLVSVALGARYFAEQNIGRRLVASAVMVAGAVLLVELGRGMEGGSRGFVRGPNQPRARDRSGAPRIHALAPIRNILSCSLG